MKYTFALAVFAVTLLAACNTPPALPTIAPTLAVTTVPQVTATTAATEVPAATNTRGARELPPT